MLQSSPSGIPVSRSHWASCVTTRKRQSSESVALTASEPNRAMGITDNIPESSFGTVNSELTASDPLLLENETTTSMLTSTGIQNSKTRCGESKFPVCTQSPPSVCTMFLHMYEQSLPKLVGGVMATRLHSQLDVEVEPCSTCEV